MAKYVSDRSFTDLVHNKFALKEIYKPLSWEEQHINDVVQRKVDVFNAVDYFFYDRINDRIVTTQERFREKQYVCYSDFTIRYERPYSRYEGRKQSEFYKLKADYFVYGIINSSKYDLDSATGFIKYAIVDIKVLLRLINDGLIIVDENLQSLRCEIRGNKLVCPVNKNRDRSSNFVPIDINYLLQLFKHTGVVIKHYGF